MGKTFLADIRLFIFFREISIKEKFLHPRNWKKRRVFAGRDIYAKKLFPNL
jgi:S-adenosylmethionine hydrolase